jgi:heptosyltransferase-2/heptosyltransferase-3
VTAANLLRRAGLHVAAVAAAGLPRPTSTPRDRVVVIRPDHLGDLLLATAVLRLLRQEQSGAEITALVGPWSASVLEGNPDVDRVLTYRFPWFDRAPLPSVGERFAAAGALATWLRTLGFDRAYVLRPDHWWGALAAALARIPERIGYGYPECRPFLTRSYAPPGVEQAVVSGLRLVAGEGAARDARPGKPAMRFEARCDAATLLGPPPRGYALLHPGASSGVKRWPAERWAAVADWLDARGVPVLLACGPGEEGELRAIQAHAERPHAATAAPPTLAQLATLLDGARVALGMDSAPMHVATAVGTPTARLYGPGDESLFGPWGDSAHHRVVRAPGTRPDPDWFGRTGGPHPTIAAIETEQVIAAVETLLA